MYEQYLRRLDVVSNPAMKNKNAVALISSSVNSDNEQSKIQI